MDFNDFVFDFQDEFLNSNIFPYDTGQLKNNFFDVPNEIKNGISLPIMTNPDVYYGKILEERASIRYRTKNHIIRHKNKHFRYIERIIEKDIIPYIERNYGAKYNIFGGDV